MSANKGSSPKAEAVVLTVCKLLIIGMMERSYCNAAVLHVGTCAFWSLEKQVLKKIMIGCSGQNL